MAVHAKDYPSFGALISALAAAHHDGHLYPMAARIGVASGTVQQWENGMIKMPKIPTLRLLSDAYGLELADVINLVSKAPGRRKMARAIRGGSGGILPPCVVQVLEKIVATQTLLQKAYRWLARPLLPVWCPA